MVATSKTGESRPQIDLRHLLPKVVALAIGLYVFRDLADYDPFVHVREGSSELEDWFFRPSGNSSALIFGVALCFLYTRHRALLRAFETPGSGGLAAWTLLVPGACLYAWAVYVAAPELILISFVLTLLGAARWLGGVAGLKAMLLPALFLLLLVPLPAAWINQVIYPLQTHVASATAVILNVIGIEAEASGTYIFTPRAIFQVIESCAGLRIMDTLLMAALIYAELFYRSRLQAVILVLSTPLLGVLTNLLRVLSLVLNPYSSFAAIHTAQGIAMLVVGVLAIAALDRILTWALDRQDPPRWVLPSRSPADASQDAAAGLRRVAPLTALLVGLAIASFAIRPWEPPNEIWLAPAKLPMEVDGWQAKSLELDKNVMGSVVPHRWTHRRYTRQSGRVELLVATDDRTVPRSNLLSTKTALPAPGFEILEVDRVQVTPEIEADSFLLGRKEERRLSYRWSVGVESGWVESFRGFFSLDRSFLRRPGRAMVVRVSTPVGPSEAGRAVAERRLQIFTQALQPELEPLMRPLEL